MRTTFVLCLTLYLCPAPMVQAAESGPARESTIPFKRSEDVANAGSVWRVVLSFGVVVALGLGAAYAIRRYIPASVGRAVGSGGRIEILEVRRVTPKLTLYLVQVDDEKILLTQSGDRVTSLRLTRMTASMDTGSEA